ncbi:MAG: caspase family protein [Bacteroidales bacterium]
MKKAICIGINNYPDPANQLNGCLNDAQDWSVLLTEFGFEVTKILDSEATKDNILNTFNNLVGEAGEGDVVVMTYSGHGTQVLDTNNDEEDFYDEALYVYDSEIVDDDLREIIANVDNKAQIVVIADSCFSGTVTKAAIPENLKPRFVRSESVPPTATLKKPFLSKVAGMEMVEILLSGCNDKEYCYDAIINGKWNGAFTAYTIPLIQKDLTYNQLYTKIREKLPSANYPQTPQLEGSDENKNLKVFTSAPVTTGNGGNNTQGGKCSLVLFSLLTFAFAVVALLFWLF